ncbi:hypothetical protein F511_40230 [Dorcoceras hygrometricum]|uniref:CCHC-type domain-containing protein n=1 Tax=Dorcoceras hygrometricum TaxID=472368 RepID=A0A2Z7B7C6_9LAMI|nr:hypothetical protein F511_40230 [Dorcoceras hygrometricum]
MADNTLKMHQFKKGLNSRIQSPLAIYQATSLEDLIGAAIRAETDIKKREADNKNKRPLNVQTSYGGPKTKRPNLSNQGPATTPNLVLCTSCGHRHSGDCCKQSGACFKCGKLGHRIADCPEHQGPKAGSSNAPQNKPRLREDKPNARVFAMTQEEAENASDVVTGIIFINKMSAYVLFDCGDTHSFISRRFAKKLGLEPEILCEPYRVATPTNTIIETHKIYRNCKISVNDQSFSANLVQFNMVEFDVILGMDWLSKNHALVDCRVKSVKLQAPDKEELVYYGKIKERKSILSAFQA